MLGSDIRFPRRQIRTLVALSLQGFHRKIVAGVTQGDGSLPSESELNQYPGMVDRAHNTAEDAVLWVSH